MVAETMDLSFLSEEYQQIIALVGADATDDELATAMVAHGDWTAGGAAAVVSLAKAYGTLILRNSLVLAATLRIEDGTDGY